jgi:Glycosyl hydrolase family 76
MTTYTEAATASYKQLAKQWGNMELFNEPDIPDSFWIAANTFQTFMDYWIATQQPPDKQISRGAVQYFHKTVKADATREDLQALTKKGLDNHGPWLDDYGWWGNAFMTALENAGALGMSPDDIEVAQKGAEDCWQLMNYGWDRKDTQPLGGGVWNCKTGDFSGRNSVTNLQYWLLSVRLHARTQDNRFLDPNTNVLTWFEDGCVQAAKERDEPVLIVIGAAQPAASANLQNFIRAGVQCHLHELSGARIFDALGRTAPTRHGVAKCGAEYVSLSPLQLKTQAAAPIWKAAFRASSPSVCQTSGQSSPVDGFRRQVDEVRECFLELLVLDKLC